MAGPITWQNVAAPNFSGAFQGMAQAQQSMDGVFTGLDGLLKKREATDTANWNQGKTNNTNALLNGVLEPKTPEEFAAKEAMLREQLGGFGAQVDATAVRSALDGRMGALQQRAVANQQYTDQQADVGQRDQVAIFRNALLGAKTAEEANAIKLGIQGAFGNGVFTPGASTDLMEKGDARVQSIVNESRAAQDQEYQVKNYEETWKNNAEQQRIARANLVVSQANATEQRKAREATTNNAGINARTNNLEAVAKVTEAQTAASKDVRDNTPYAKSYNDTNMETVRKAAIEINKDSSSSNKYGDAVISKLAELKKELKGDIPLEVVQSALSMAKGDLFDSFRGNNSYANSVAGFVREQMKDPEILKQIVYAKEQTSKSKAQYESTTPAPTGNAAIGVAPSGVVAPAASPQTKFVPPKVSETGSLVYDKPGSLNISGQKGIMVPSSVPTGSLEATVPDGDTISVKGANNVTMKFRFNGLDTQETSKTKDGKTTPGQKYGEAARTFITDAFKQGRVDIKMSSNKPDAYGRHVADIYVDGKSLNEALISNGHATVMTVKGGMGPSQTAEFQRLQKLAMAKNLGIMGDLNSDRTPTGAAYRMFGDNLYN